MVANVFQTMFVNVLKISLLIRRWVVGENQMLSIVHTLQTAVVVVDVLVKPMRFLPKYEPVDFIIFIFFS
jgi:hypothetical protein